MPLAYRTILPEWLGRRTLSEEEGTEDLAPVAVCHNAFLGAIVQLASLVRHADDIFCDLAEECQRVFDKTQYISSKITNLDMIITQLDSTQVQIPVGTLKQFSSVIDHHVAKHGFDCDHFTPGNRPYCIRFNYSMCEPTPVHALRGVDPLRKDGQISSHLFKLWPIALKDMEIHMDEISVPRRYSSPLAQKKRYKMLKLKERRRTIHSIDEIYHDESSSLQTSMADNLSRSQPSIMVSVDTSGSGFERMTLFRQSLGDDGRTRTKKRRRTVSGVPDNIMQEIEQFEEGRRISRNSPRKYSLDDLDQKDIDAKDEIMQQYLMEIDSAIAERKEVEYAEQRETKLFKFIPCRRSRSLPRCVKLLTSRGREELTLSSVIPKKLLQKAVADERQKPTTDELDLYATFSGSASLGSLSGEDAISSRSSKRSSLIGNKIKSLVAGTLKPRPKSLDFDSIEVMDDSKKKSRTRKTEGRSSSLSRVSSPSTHEETITRTSSNESQVGQGSYYYFDSHTLPRTQAKKYDFPWDSLPKDWTTSVKLRAISKQRKEDRQSSSGNWSQSGYSSNRQSVDSDAKSSMPSSMSQASLGKDSGRDSPRSTGERDGLDLGYMGDAASTESVSDTKSLSNTDSEEWIRSLAEQAANRGDVTSTSVEALANLSRLTKQNILNLDILVPGRTHFRQKRNELEDDGESSVYSIDQEGFYTSFHSDSGLRRSTITLLDEDDDLMMPRVRESKSLQSVTSCTTVKSVIFRPDGNDSSGSASSDTSRNLATLLDVHKSDVPDIDCSEDYKGQIEYGESGTLKAKKKTYKKRRVPPLPPPRTTSISSYDQTPDEGLNSLNDSPTNIETSSESSDHETIYARLKMKTGISAHTFPSWCVGIASDEDDFQDRLNAESSEVEELVSGKDNWLSGTLPRPSITSDIKASSEFDQTANSWPRVKRVNPQQPGILKTHEKDKSKPIPSNTKVLNFDPVVNLFDACSPHGVQMPLSRLSSSDESGSPGTCTFEAHPLSQKYSLPLSLNDQDVAKNVHSVSSKESFSHKEISKHQLATTATRESTRPRSMVLYTGDLPTLSTPPHSHHSALYSGKAHLNLSGLSAIHTSSTPSIDLDSFDAPLNTSLATHDNSENRLTSNSTIALSDIDSSSLTHVTMSEDSSPSGSTLSLNWDTDDTPNPTPMATPVRKHAPFNLPYVTNDSITSLDRNSSVSSGAVQCVINSNNSAQQLNMPSSSNQTAPSTLLSAVSCDQNKNAHHISHNERPSPPFSGSAQLESGHVLTATHLPPGHNFTSRTSAAHETPMQMCNVSSSAASSNISDSNNNRNKAANVLISDSAIVKLDSWNQNGVYPNDILPDSSLTHSQISTNVPPSVSGHSQQQQPHLMNTVYRSAQSDRRRSSPNMGQAINSSSSTSSSGIKDGFGFKNRRQSDNKLYSPADSGYGSPSVVSPSNMTSQTFSYSSSQTNQQHYSVAQPQMTSSSLSITSSTTPLNKEPLLKDSRPASSSFIAKSASSNINSIIRPDYAAKFLRQTSNQSNESLSSQFSVSSTQQLISKAQSSDGAQHVLHRENSSESVHSNGSGGRSDSYRVAMLVDSDEANLIPNKMANITNDARSSKNNSLLSSSPVTHRPQLSKPLTLLAPAEYADDVSRADSYRCAVRNTQSKLFADAFGRNTSYRLATYDEDAVITDSRMDACNLWTGKTGASRDVRRMGITDIDQLKHYSNDQDDNEKSGHRGSVTKSSNTPHAKKKLSTKPEAEGLINLNRGSTTEPKRFMRSSSKDKAKQKTQSSTYIRFDPIFESGEDLRASSESLRPPSIVSIRTLAKAESNEVLTSENAHLIKQRVSATSPTRKRSSSHGRRDDKPSLSIFGSIKTTIKSMGGTKGE